MTATTDWDDAITAIQAAQSSLSALTDATGANSGLPNSAKDEGLRLLSQAEALLTEAAGDQARSKIVKLVAAQ